MRGQPLIDVLRPEPNDYFVLKPKPSAFYTTTLELLLASLQVDRLIMTGISAEVCVLLSASDAYLSEFAVYVPADCVASDTVEHTQDALTYMKRVLKADITPGFEMVLPALSQAEELVN